MDPSTTSHNKRSFKIMRRLSNNNSFYNLSCINVSINNHIMKMVLIE